MTKKVIEASEKVTKKRPKESKNNGEKVIQLLLPTSFCGTLRRWNDFHEQEEEEDSRIARGAVDGTLRDFMEAMSIELKSVSGKRGVYHSAKIVYRYRVKILGFFGM